MNKITIEEFVKRVNALKAGEHISVQLIEDGYIVTAFATLVKGNRYHFMMIEGFYGNCEMGFECFNYDGVMEYIDYVKEMADDTSELDEITELIVVEEKKLVDYGSLKNERKNIQEKTKAFLDEVLLKHGERFDLKCNDYDSWEDAIDHEASNITNQLPYCVTCQDWSGDSFDLYLTSVKLVEGGHVAYVTGYSFDEGHGYEEDVKCSLYTGNLEAVADFVHLVLEEEKDLNGKCQGEKMDVITDKEMFDLFARTFKGKDVDTSNEDELYETAQCIFSESCNKIESVIPWLKDGESDGESTWYDQYHDEIVSLYCSILKDEVRRCDNCGKLMKEGYYLGGEFACSDECCLALYGGDKQQMEEDLSHAEEDDGECYWTEWESYYFED